MATRRQNFTKKLLESLHPAERGRRAYIYDAKERGLVLAITDRGTKSFVLYRWIRGKPERIFLGHFPDMTIAQARGKAAGYKAQIAEGKNPADSRRRDRDEMTLQDLFDEYLERHAKPTKRTWREDQSKFRQYLTSADSGMNLAVRKLSAVSKNDIARLHTKIGQTHPPTANRVLTLLSSVFGRASEWGLWDENPCRGIRKYKEHSRDRFLQADELPRFFEALARPSHRFG